LEDDKMIELRTAENKDKELYRNMFNMLHNDISPYNNELLEVDEKGYFDKDTIECYFNGDENVFPYVITYNNKIAGCVVISKPPYVKPGCDFCIQELFVLGLYRGKDIASGACLYLLEKYKGKYCVIVLKENHRAMKFWRKFIDNNATMILEEELDKKSIVFEFLT
jgi:predicted acetyltransferase